MERRRKTRASWNNSITLIIFGLILLALLLTLGLSQLITHGSLKGFAKNQVEANNEYLLQQKKENLKNLVQAPMDILARYEQDSKSTEELEQVIDLLEKQIDAVLNDFSDLLTNEEKRLKIKKLVRATRFGPEGNNFIWIIDQHRVISHLTPQVEGLPLDDPRFTDAKNKKPFLAELVKACNVKSSSKEAGVGEARLEFWTPGTDGRLSLQLAYIRHIPDLDLYLVGTLQARQVTEEKMSQALDEIRRLRLPDGNYFWVNDLQPVMLVHPLRPELIGQDLALYKDSKGTFPFRVMVDICKHEGEGFLEYQWSKPDQNSEKQYPKLSYVKLFKPWNLIVGMGVHTDDITSESQGRSQQLMTVVGGIQIKILGFGFIVLVLVFILVSTLVNKLLIEPVKSLEQYSQRISEGKTERRAIKGKFLGELKGLKKSFEIMLAKLQEKIREAEDKGKEAAKQAEQTKEALATAKRSAEISGKIESYQQAEVEKLSAMLTRMAEGDLSVSYAVGDGDEDTAFSRAAFLRIQNGLGSTARNLAAMLREIKDNSGSLSKAADALSMVSEEMLYRSQDMSNQANTVAGATEQMSINVNNMASAAEQMNVNVSNVSSTTEEMSHAVTSIAKRTQEVNLAIQEVAGNAKQGAEVAQQAVARVESASQTMNALGEAAKEIGKVTEVIKRIAEQTNLLALNATIEAASAGDAGKGFAVVAGEIKELANQSAAAAEEISEKIHGVQESTTQAVEVINQVVGTIRSINDSVSVITRAVERQTTASDDIATTMTESESGIVDIARSMSELSNTAMDLSSNSNEFASALTEVAENILRVSRAVDSGQAGVKGIDTHCRELVAVAERLSAMVKRFNL